MGVRGAGPPALVHLYKGEIWASEYNLGPQKMGVRGPGPQLWSTCIKVKFGPQNIIWGRKNGGKGARPPALVHLYKGEIWASEYNLGPQKMGGKGGRAPRAPPPDPLVPWQIQYDS